MKRKGSRWDARALQIRERDDYTCQKCGQWGNEVDHIVAIRHGGTMWKGGNLQVLCSKCHRRKTDSEWNRDVEGTAEWREMWLELRGELVR